jgi:hypothetical protein
MKALLVAAGASVAYGQATTCFGNNATNCTGVVFTGQFYNATCQISTGYCGRNTTAAPACDTAAMTCTGNACAAGATVQDGKTCSKCADTCFGATAAACTAAANNGACTWYADSCGQMAAPTPAVACSATAKAGCTAEMGCYWLSYSSTVCGAARAVARCYQCNSTSFDLATRSALFNNKGKTCTWPAVAPYSASSLSIVDVTQSTDTANCPALAAMATTDAATITTAAKAGRFNLIAFDTAVATCVETSGVSALMPSMALLALIAAVVA